ncbi:DEKNAAC104056 [Brettanomyces naardenensis]|uniref:DEKNAAC104056 n=1 Tax=Brettanomyces naardenensis TaxID=13370 RepID=A0A448YPT4_BRENA|nr:DEKNAAC104056 [Brettanomyces naardenensis]
MILPLDPHLQPSPPTPGVLTIAGSDCSGGAGLEADIKTITVSRCYAITCITALTAQNSHGVHHVLPTPTDTVKRILATLNEDDLNLKAVKIGLLPATGIEPVKDYLSSLTPPTFVVLDPVFVANSGDSFGDSDSLAPKLISLFKYCTLVTPNFVETQIILGRKIQVESVKSLSEAAALIGQKTHTSVLVKGGHIPFDKDGIKVSLSNPETIYNVLYEYPTGNTYIFRTPYVHSKNTHGTGCTMSSFIASSLAKGSSLKEAVKGSIEFVSEAIRHSEPKDNGPVNHLWRELETDSIEDGTKDGQNPSHYNLLHHLVSDDQLSPLWVNFTSHPFFKSLNNGTLSESGIKHFLVQDYSYLKVFLACHQRLCQIAPSPEAREVMQGATEAVKNELAGHVKLLKEKFDIEDPETIESSKALTTYVEYFNKLLEDGNFVELETSLIPCQFGFNHAVSKYYKPENFYDTLTGEFVTGDSLYEDCCSEYEPWLEAAVSERYCEVCRTLQRVYNSAYNDLEVKNEKKIREIFARGCELEYEFWDECFKA